MDTRLIKGKVSITLCLLLILSWALPAFSNEKGISDERGAPSTSEARISVEKAWEVYHHAALGGTLASPMLQTRLEEDLHRSRALLAEAYDAEDRGDLKTMKKRINQIMNITNKVIDGSQEPKK